MNTTIVTILNKLGLHARAAAKFVAIASHYNCHIEVKKDNKKVNGKSIMGVMMLAASQGCELEISAQGNDAADALTALKNLILNKFDEDE